jgi:hypothetical protein
MIEAGSFPASSRSKVSVAGTHGQSVCLAHSGANDYFYVKAQVFHHSFYDYCLLGILLAEIRTLWLESIKKLCYHRCHTVKKSWPGSAFQYRSHLRYLDKGLVTGGGKQRPG